MRKLCVCIFISFVACLSYGQSKVEKYFQITMAVKNDLSRIRVTHLSSGESPGLLSLKDSGELKQLQRVNELTTQADVLDYMAQHGWHSTGINYIGYAWVVMYFKKEFDKSELINP